MKSFFQKLKNRYWIEQWNVGVLKASKEDVLSGRLDLSQTQWLLEEKGGGFYADPFFLPIGNGNFLFFEEFNNKTQKGKISKVEIVFNGSQAKVSPIDPSIEQRFHMSFPFFVEEKGTTYMIPETSEAGEIAAYQMDEENKKWRKKQTLIAGFAGLDSTIFLHKGKWWLFCTNGNEGPNSNLHIFFADELFGEWRSHRQNPVKIDLESARPAGPIFEHKGRLYRPTQNCLGTYGKEIVVNEIVVLTPKEFIEEETSRISAASAQRYNKGMHTISFFGDHILIDGKRFAGLKNFFHPFVSAAKKIISKS